MHYRIRCYESAQLRVIIPCIIIIQPGSAVKDLPRVFPARAGSTGLIHCSIGRVGRCAYYIPASVRQQVCAAKVIAVIVVKLSCVLLGCYQFPVCVYVLCCVAAGFLIYRSYINRDCFTPVRNDALLYTLAAVVICVFLACPIGIYYLYRPVLAVVLYPPVIAYYMVLQ